MERIGLALFSQLYWLFMYEMQESKTELCKSEEIIVRISCNTKAQKGMTMVTAP